MTGYRTVSRYSSVVLLWVSVGASAGGPAADPFEPDDSPATAQRIINNEAPQARTLHVANDVDWIKAYLVLGAVYRIGLDIGNDLRDAAIAILPDTCVLAVDVFDADGNPVRYPGGSPLRAEFPCDDAQSGEDLQLDFTFGDGAIVAPEGTYFFRVATLGAPFVPLAGSYAVRLANPFQPASGRLAGSVRAQDTMQPIVDANVLIRTAADAIVRDSGFSDELGNFNFPPDAGTYQLRVFKDGYQSSDWTIQATVAAGQTTTLPEPVTLTPLSTTLPPDVTNPLFVGPVSATAAAVQASVNPNGGISSATFDAVPAAGGTFRTQSDTVQTDETTAFVVIEGLSSCSDYTLQVSAANSAGTDDADPAEFRTFRTAGCVVNPVIDSASADATENAATLLAGITTSNLETFVRFEYGVAGGGFTSTTETAYTGATIAPSATVGPLACGTSHAFRVFARNAGGGSAQSADIPFATDACPAPLISGLGATGVTRTTATLGGLVETRGQGVSGAIEYRRNGAVVWELAGSFALADAPGAQPVSAGAANLACGTLHQFRVRIDQPAFQELVDQFTTGACTPPTIVSTSVPAVDLASVTLQAAIETNSLPYELVFEHRVQGSGGAWTPTATIIGTAMPVSQSKSAIATGLACSTTYEYRAVAQNVDGATVRNGMPGATTVDCSVAIFRDGFE